MDLLTRNGTYTGPPSILGADGRPIQRQGSEYHDGLPIPHVLTLASIYQASWQQYFPEKWDESRRNRDGQFYKVMRNNCHLMGLLYERKRSVTKLRWHLEPEDAKDPVQQAVADGMAKTIRSTPRLRQLLRSKMEALWYGRAGVQCKWVKEVMRVPVVQQRPYMPGVPSAGPSVTMGEREVRRIVKHLPINGDKIVYKTDDTPMVAVHASEVHHIPGAYYEPTAAGYFGLVLKGGWRNMVLIHKHEVIDADFWDAESADAIHGVGIRSFLAWTENMRQEHLAQLCTFMERVGLGITFWLYPGHDKAAKAEATQAATDQSNRTNFVVPVWGDNAKMAGIQRIEVNPGGVDALFTLIKHLEELQERFVVGQAGSADSETSGMGTHDTGFQERTKGDIVEEDADNMAETCTGTDEEPGLCSIIFRYSYPEYLGKFSCPRWQFNVQEEDPEAVLAAVEAASGLGVHFREDEVRDLTGLSKPEDGDDVVGGQQQGPGGEGGDDPFSHLDEQDGGDAATEEGF